ncbi:MAG: hypothetical protein KME05_10085 [Gloeocapsa sp. UFS-A4-WI-NPMV-4B04]|jgi:hypothetical protein|nr:hypothetical protein [Gloeocapsa sp. UFS-A4-WI-NPMV-4B04]
MESTANNDKYSLPQAIYRAVGSVAGTYQPSEDDVHQGIFITEDDLSVPAQLTWQLRGRLKHKNPEYATQPDFFSQSFRWIVYPKTEPMRFDLAAMKQLKAEPTINRLGLDEFCVVGLVKSIEQGRVDVRIQRNQPPRQGRKKRAFNLTLAGSLSDEAIGQIWELKVRRDGETLIIIGGQPYEPSAEDLVWLEQQRQAAIHVSSLSAPILKQQHKADSQEDTTIAAPKSPAVAPALEEPKKTPDVIPQALPSADAHLTTGKMEVVVKLNQFPDDVKTLAQGWKEFEVNTGDCMVTISVKPKAFAALEQAQQAYPSWVAAISGVMGESTAAGFRLESPAIKVFEKKAKNTQAEEPKTLDNLESSPTNQPPGAGQTQTQQQVAQPKPESLQERSPVVNPMQLVKEPLKQQRPSKASPPKSHQQHDQTADRKKQLSPLKTSTEPQQQKPVFQVKVNDRVFNGYDSVTLNRRIVCVDGKAIAQTKMAIVIGQPKTMQADGGVTQGNNQAVLLSK